MKKAKPASPEGTFQGQAECELIENLRLLKADILKTEQRIPYKCLKNQRLWTISKISTECINID